MANENILRDRWAKAFRETRAYKDAELAAEESKLARRAEFDRRRKLAEADPAALDALNRAEQAADGTGPGEIKLAALQSLHAGEVNRYINDARKDQQARSSLPSSVGETVPTDPDFSNHYPWIKPNFDVGESAGQMVNTAKQRVAANGGTWAPTDELYASRASGARRSYDKAAAVLADDDRRRDNAARVRQLQDRQAYNLSVQDAQRARTQLLAARAKGRQDVSFDPNRPSLGGTLTRNGQRYMSSPTGPVAFPSADSMPDDPRDQPADGPSDNDGHDSEGRAETDAELKSYNEQVPRDTPQNPSFDHSPPLSGYAAMSSPRFASAESAGSASPRSAFDMVGSVARAAGRGFQQVASDGNTFDVVDNRFRPGARSKINRVSYEE